MSSNRVNGACCGISEALLFTYFLKINIIITSNFPLGFCTTNTFNEAWFSSDEHTSTIFLCHHNMGSPKVPSSNPNHFVCLRIELNFPSDAMIYEGSPPQDATTFDKPIEPEIITLTLMIFMVPMVVIQVLSMMMQQQTSTLQLATSLPHTK